MGLCTVNINIKNLAGLTPTQMGGLKRELTAIFNAADLTLIFNNPRASSGPRLSFNVSIVIARTVAADDFTLLQPAEMSQDTHNLLVGCDPRAYDQINGRMEDKDDRATFEQDMYVSFGRGCINVTRPGIYTITATLSNSFAVLTPSGRNFKSAVGSTTSTPLVIRVVE